MPPDERDAALLWDMLEACRSVQRFLAGRQLDDYLSDEIIQAAVERKIQIIGEAAWKVSTRFRDEHPEIPWSLIAGQRHVLVHDYGRIEHDRLWNVATIKVTLLTAQLELLLPPV